MNQLPILYLVSLLMDMSVAAVIFAISRRAAELGATASQLGWLGAAWIGLYAVLALVTGRFSDRVGRRKLAFVGCIIAAGMALACSLTTQVGLLLVFSAIFGGGLACFWPSIIAWLGEGLSGHALAARLTTFSVAWNIGLLLGYCLSGVLFEHSPRLVFYASTGTILLVGLLLLLPGRQPPRTTPSDERLEIPKGRGFRKTAWLANFATNFSLTGTAALFPQLATHRDRRRRARRFAGSGTRGGTGRFRWFAAPHVLANASLAPLDRPAGVRGQHCLDWLRPRDMDVCRGVDHRRRRVGLRVSSEHLFHVGRNDRERQRQRVP